MNKINKFKLASKYKPSDDQQNAINAILNNIKTNTKDQVLKGVTGSGKTFTIANIIASQNKPALIMSHNKTLASQLYNDIKNFFPENKVEYFVSNFEFYIPEAYNPKTQTYNDKSSSVNEQLDAMRISTISSLLTRNDTIVIASVACIYGTLDPNEYSNNVFMLSVGQDIKIKNIASKLVSIGFTRNKNEQSFGSFIIKGDIIEIVTSFDNESLIRISMFGDVIESIKKIDITTKKTIKIYDNYRIFPASSYTVQKPKINDALKLIEKELLDTYQKFMDKNELIKAQRIDERTRKDMEDMAETGFCKGMENYSRYFDNRKPGEKPFTLLDYFPKNSLLFIDESHISVGQLNGMYGGDHTRKQNLVDYGYRLPSALDNRPLKFDEFNNYDFNRIYVSATPQEYEINKSLGVMTEMIIRPTGLLDPKIILMKTNNQIEIIYDELKKQEKNNERTFIVTTTIKATEELTSYLRNKGLKVEFIHGEHDAIERHEILRKLRLGKIDTVVGINLLKEGIDVPEVSLIIILDADATSFTRSTTSLIQIIGRAARNKNGRVIMFADKITSNIKQCIEDNERKRKIQIKYNIDHNITPQSIIKPIPESLVSFDISEAIKLAGNVKLKNDNKLVIENAINELRERMNLAAKNRDYETAMICRDQILELGGELN
ncbi:excinuclease ABC subunit UvrB [Mycoplasma elephantis]|uniref:excinuclease ABC subunit UvrB n=1 Tax=Mycoplasma elephantis TaxID=114882 RepID=UPI00055D41E9|nr:excinuclease ABC subunit UvrB [Mycoplasma elephantis]